MVTEASHAFSLGQRAPSDGGTETREGVGSSLVRRPQSGHAGSIAEQQDPLEWQGKASTCVNRPQLCQ
jgi:hypothetical protein